MCPRDPCGEAGIQAGHAWELCHLDTWHAAEQGAHRAVAHQIQWRRLNARVEVRVAADAHVPLAVVAAGHEDGPRPRRSQHTPYGVRHSAEACCHGRQRRRCHAGERKGDRRSGCGLRRHAPEDHSAQGGRRQHHAGTATRIDGYRGSGDIQHTCHGSYHRAHDRVSSGGGGEHQSPAAWFQRYHALGCAACHRGGSWVHDTLGSGQEPRG